tara:strand:- start:118 stop:498 length:381 start_codon:yes stop_codon:yes gene_type:complete
VRFCAILLLLTALNGGNDLPLFNIIQSNLSKYRQSITSSDFSFQNGIIRLKLDGRRTNIKSQMLLGFYSTGLALNRMDIPCREIEIVIHYNVKTRGQVSARASAEEVMNLSQGRLSSEQFFIQIGY